MLIKDRTVTLKPPMAVELYYPTRPNSLIKKIWSVSLEGFVNYQVLPEASVNLVFNLGSSFSSLKGRFIQKSFHSPQEFCFLAGIYTNPVFASPCSYVMAVEMHPMAVSALFGIPCSEIKNNVINGDMFLNDLNKVEDKLLGSGTFQEKAVWLENYLYAKINETSELGIAKKMNIAIGKMHANLLHGKKAEMQDYTGYSRMHTHRLSTQWLGLSPMKYLRLKQFIKSLNDLHFTQRLSAEIASSNGFFDQTHFNRIFRQFTEMTPRQYKEKKSDLVGQIFSRIESNSFN